METNTNSKKPHIRISSSSGSLAVHIETERLIIRSYKEDDFEECVNLYGDPILTKYFDHGKPRSREEVKSLINERGKKYTNNKEPFGLFSVFKKEDLSFLGQADLIPYSAGSLEIGCIFHRQYHNNGFCLEAVRALIFDYTEYLNLTGILCQGMPINKIIASAHPKNYASIRACKNLGMTLEKTEERFGNPRAWYSCSFEQQFKNGQVYAE